jgi:hypothetical protein
LLCFLMSNKNFSATARILLFFSASWIVFRHTRIVILMGFPNMTYFPAFSRALIYNIIDGLCDLCTHRRRSLFLFNYVFEVAKLLLFELLVSF